MLHVNLNRIPSHWISIDSERALPLKHVRKDGIHNTASLILNISINFDDPKFIVTKWKAL